MPLMTQDATSLSAEQVAHLLQAARHRPELPCIEWSGDDQEVAEPRAIASQVREASGPVSQPVESNPRTYDAVRKKIRDRYIGIRFMGVARSGEDLQDASRVIKAARLAFEEEHAETALELLALAIEQDPREPALWLAEFEIAFLVRDRQRYADSARAFRTAFPEHAEWNEITRLGRALAPDEPLFGNRQAPRRHEHYGPWPHTPNWIQAPWDLTAEVLAAEFHRAMLADGHPAGGSDDK